VGTGPDLFGVHAVAIVPNLTLNEYEEEPSVSFVGIVFLFLSLLTSNQLPASQGTPTGTLKGVVTGPSGELAHNAKVRVEQWYFDEGKPHVLTEAVSFTGEKGEFSLSVPAGVYDVFVSAPTCEPVAKKVKVISGKGTSFNPKLRISKLAEFIE
jgi:hypothetical protein